MTVVDERTAQALVGQPMGLFIDGDFVESGRWLSTLNPATGSVLADVACAGDGDVAAAVDAATAAFGAWRRTSPNERARLIWRLADLLESERLEFARVEVLDSGKPLSEAILGDVPFAVDVLRYYAGWATKVDGTVPATSAAGMLALTRREPVGVVAAITPWNFPLLQAAYKLGPALAAGCTMVVKPSELAPLTTLRLARLVQEAGFPPGVVNIVVGGPAVGASLVRHPGVAKVAFTGQTTTGKDILRASVDRLTRVSLELGGKSPHIVFADANLERATAAAFRAIFYNQGQVCTAGSRLVVEESVADEVVGRLAERAAGVRLGFGLDAGVDMGPVISFRQCQRIQGFVDSARADGAVVAAGGAPVQVDGLEGGFFFAPTVLAAVRPGTRVEQEEVFGPVLTVTTWSSPEELLDIANGVEYGLAAGIWTSDTSKALRIAEQLDVGTVWVNSYGRFDAAVPFGGRKQSGFGGRELGREALDAYLHEKSIWVDLDAPMPERG